MYTVLLRLAEQHDSHGHPSVQGHLRFIDNRLIDWIKESVLSRMGFTASMYNQIILESINNLIQTLQKEPQLLTKKSLVN